MTSIERGDVVLVAYVFADEYGVKRRPALVLSSAKYTNARSEAILVAITSNTQRLLFGDAPIVDWRGAGLWVPSVLTAIVRTIKQSMVSERLGRLGKEELHAAEKRLRSCLDLN